jgi:hypothetical protein
MGRLDREGGVAARRDCGDLDARFIACPPADVGVADVDHRALLDMELESRTNDTSSAEVTSGPPGRSRRPSEPPASRSPP